jgi:predicted nucleic acid-binding protein
MRAVLDASAAAAILLHKPSAGLLLEAIREGIGLIDEYADGQFLWREAFSEGVRLKVPIYDMFYLVTTRRNDGRLLTMDRKLIGLCKKSGLKVAE